MKWNMFIRWISDLYGLKIFVLTIIQQGNVAVSWNYQSLAKSDELTKTNFLEGIQEG